MDTFFFNLRNTVAAGFVLTAVVFVIYLALQGFDGVMFWPFLLRWLHVISGIMWIGLLWYFNFVPAPLAPDAAAGARPAADKSAVAAALFWFRWSAMATLVLGILLAGYNRYFVQVITIDGSERFANPAYINLGVGMWLGIVMWFGMWFIVWPNRQKALNLGGRYPHLTAEERAAAARTAVLFGRVGTMLSIPLLFCMVATAHLYGAV